jgi:NAD(P)-dependent dehydrogenase (short-subunit alcohol dehydrogenase family)
MSGTARRVLITGASKGIGLATARQLHAQGHQAVGIARTAPPSFPGQFIKADLADVEATAKAADEALLTGNVDALVNNVGLVRPAMLGEVNLDDLAQVFDLNVRTAVQLTQAVFPGMRERGWGRIVSLTTLVTLGHPGRTAYGAAKAWAGELAASGVTVNAVAPGPTETELFRASSPPGSPGEKLYLDRVPQRRFGRPEEIAAGICFLLSDQAAFITGQTLRIDGGGSIGA